MSSLPVLVTGASGYLASHIIYQLLKKGVHVRGTVRCVTNAKKVDPLMNMCPEAKTQLQLVEADLLQTECWSAALSGGIQEVYHIASPLPPSEPDNPEDVIKPAVNGTLNILKACRKSKQVKKVVLTSSCASIWDFKITGRVLNENDWADTEEGSAYNRSKPLAEKAAWDYIKNLPSDEKFDLAVVNPGFIVGPLLFKGSFTSANYITQFLQRETSRVPILHFPTIDVRDCAETHIMAMKTPEASGHRIISAASHMWFNEMCEVMKDEFGEMGYDVPTKTMPVFLMKILACFNKQARFMKPLLGLKAEFDNSMMLDVLKIQPRPFKETISSMCHSLIQLGMAKRTKLYKSNGYVSPYN